MKKTLYEYYLLFKDYAAASDSNILKSEVRTLLSIMTHNEELAADITNTLLEKGTIPSFGIEEVVVF